MSASPHPDDISLLTTAEAARAAGVSVSAVKAWLRRGKLHPYRLGRRVLVSEREVLDLELRYRDAPRGRPRADTM